VKRPGENKGSKRKPVIVHFRGLERGKRNRAREERKWCRGFLEVSEEGKIGQMNHRGAWGEATRNKAPELTT